jgi:hypothetical protein
VTESETDLARRLLGDVLNGELKWTPDMRLRIATVAQAYAFLAIVDELRWLNTRNDRFDTALMAFFERLTEDPMAAPATSQQEGEDG